MFKSLAAVLLVLSFFIPKVRSQSGSASPSPMVYPTEEEYIRSLRLELKWITPSYILAIAGTFFMTLAMIFLFLRGKQIRRAPCCCRGCSPGWTFCCTIPIVVVIATLIAEMVLLSSPDGIYLIYLEIIVTSALKSSSLGVFFVLLMVYAIATVFGLAIFVIFAIQYAAGRKKRLHTAGKVVKLTQNFNKDAQSSSKVGSTTIVHSGNREWAVIDIGHLDDDSTLGTTSSSPGSDDELHETSENATSTETANEADRSMGSRFQGLY